MEYLENTKWLKKMKVIYEKGISNAFIVTGNIKDYAVSPLLVKDYIMQKLEGEFRLKEVYTFSLNRLQTNLSNQPNEDLLELKNLFQLLTTKDSVGVIVEYPEFIFANDESRLSENEKRDLIMLEDLLSNAKFCASNNILVLLTESRTNINKRFLGNNSKTEVIEIELPTMLERYNFIKKELAPIKDQQITLEQLTKVTAGLSLLNISDIILSANYECKLTLDMVLSRKKDLIQKEYNDIIEIMDSDGLNLAKFAGQDLIKDYIREAVIEPIKEGDVSIVPKGILLMGPPGTGKTYFSRCLAGDAGMNFVEFKMSKILDKYVGEAEKNLARAMGVFKALAPVGVFIDEVDQALSRGESDSNSVSKNLFGMFLAEMSKPENRGKILWLGATNYPNKLDEAFKRAGRFDKKLPFFAPDERDRERVFKIHLEKTKFPLENIDYYVLSEKTDGYTQAEIENIVVKALELAKRKKKSVIDQELVLMALSYMKHAQNDKIKEMEEIAVAECNDYEFLPEKYHQS